MISQLEQREEGARAQGPMPVPQKRLRLLERDAALVKASMEKIMKKIAVIGAAFLLVTSSFVGLAQAAGKTAPRPDPGKSGTSPGDIKNDKNDPGKSGTSPGDIKNDSGAPNAKNRAPGQTNDPGKSGSSPGDIKHDTGALNAKNFAPGQKK